MPQSLVAQILCNRPTLAVVLFFVHLGAAMGQSGTAAEITSPTPGSKLTSGNVTFQWNTGTNVSQYTLYIGDTCGQSNYDNINAGTATSYTVTNLPTDGLPFCIQLNSLIGSDWVGYATGYYASGQGVPAAITSPAAGSTLTGSTATFTWTSGTAVTQYQLSVGTTPGGSDLATVNAGSATSAVVTNLPTNGCNLYVTLSSLNGQTWLSNSYQYLAAGSGTPAVLQSPGPGSTLTGSTVTFYWNGGSGNSEFALAVGSTSGADDIANIETTAGQATVTGLPTNGETIYVSLSSKNGSNWFKNDYTYVAAGTGVPAQITSPVPSSKFPSGSVKFVWTKGSGITAYTLSIGTSPGASNIDHIVSSNTSATVTNLPTNGETIYVSLSSLNGNTTVTKDYTYYASGTGVAAAITSPMPGTRFFNSDATFTWNKGRGIAKYELLVGTAAGLANIDLVHAGTAPSATFSDLPTNGKPIYVTLRSLNGDIWLKNSYVFSASEPVTISTNGLHYGEQGVGQTAPGQTILLTNTSTTTPATMTANVAGKGFVQFNNCPAPSGSLARGAFCSYNVFFTPSAAGKETGTLAITGTASTGSYRYQIGLAGTGVTQWVQVLPSQPTKSIAGLPIPFIANVTGLTDTSVNWSVDGYAGGAIAVGTINTSGIYFGPNIIPNDTTATETVTAASATEPDLTGSATVTIESAATPNVPAIYPGSASVEAGKTLQIESWPEGYSTWAVNGITNGNATVGRVRQIEESTNAPYSIIQYTAPAKVSAPKTVAVGPVISGSVPLTTAVTVTPSNAISIESLDKSSLMPYQLLTLNGAGFNPESVILVTFTDDSKFSIAVPPVSVSANNVVVGVPPFFSSPSVLGSGTVNVQVSQTISGATAKSNTVDGFLIQAPPASKLPPGTVTANFLTGLAGGIANVQSLIAGGAGAGVSGSYPDGSLQYPEFIESLILESRALNAVTPQVAGIASGSIASFRLAQTAKGANVMVTSADLAVTDRLILAMIAAQTGSSWSSSAGDPPSCPDYAGAEAYDALSTPGAVSTSAQVSQYFGGAFTQCRADAVVGGLHVTGAALATGVAALAVLGAPTVLVSAGAAGVMTFSAASFAGLAAIGGYLGRGTWADAALIQGAAGQMERFIKTPVLEATGILAEQSSEALAEGYNLLHLLADSLELIHAVNDEVPLGSPSGEASPYYGGPMATSEFTASVSGSGTGNIVSVPGGVICGSDFQACTQYFPPDQTIYLDGQPDPGSTLPTLAGACEGSGICKFTTGSSESAVASFSPIGGTGQGSTPLQIPSNIYGIYSDGCVEPSSSSNNNVQSSIVQAQKLVAIGGSPTSGYTWSITPGSIYPPGTTVDPLTGIFKSTGGQLVPGTYSFSMTVTDATGDTAVGQYQYVVTSSSACPVPAVPFDEDQGGNTISGPNAVIGQSYGVALPLIVGFSGTGIYAPGGEAKGGLNLPLTWSISSGSLPPGLLLDQSTGVVWGEPSGGSGQKFTVQFQVKNSAGQIAACSAGKCPSFAVTVGSSSTQTARPAARTADRSWISAP
ncbi:MAG: putative Ig domain-containing protein [Terracidiphilus sp.]